MREKTMIHNEKMKEIVALLHQLTANGGLAWEKTTHDRTAAVARLWGGGVRLYPGLRYSLELLDDRGKVESTYTPAGADAEALAAVYGLASEATQQYPGMVDSVLAELKLRSLKS
jgi:hypothetical protein